MAAITRTCERCGATRSIHHMNVTLGRGWVCSARTSCKTRRRQAAKARQEARPESVGRMTIYANSNVSRGKFAAAAVHAALNHYGIEHGAVIVLGQKPGVIEQECSVVIRDAGRTEVDPGTVTAGVKEAVPPPGADDEGSVT